MNMDARKRMKKTIRIFGILLLTICIVIPGTFYLYVRHSIYESPDNTKPLHSNDSMGSNDEQRLVLQEDEEIQQGEEEPEIEYEEVAGITNILLIGTDGRTLEENARSDSIIIATMDTNNKKIKFTSIMRDSYVDIRRHGTQKINAAYAYGGPELLLETIEKNFKIKIEMYIIVNFWGFQEVVDMLGGLDIDIKDYEISEINKFIGEVNDCKSYSIERSGPQHLDGQQVLAYSRIRQVGNGSYERNKRQREVVSLLAGKLKSIKVIQYSQLMHKLLPCIKTNIEPITLLNMAYTVSRFRPMTIEQLQMPMTELSEGRIYNGTWVFLMDKEQNSKVLNDFIFRDKLPKPEELNIRSFRSKINQYLQAEIKSNPTINQKDEQLKKEPSQSDHNY